MGRGKKITPVVTCDFDLKANLLSTVISDVNYHLQLLSMK